MKRSEINTAIIRAIAFFENRKFPLPPFAYWNVRTWRKQKPYVRELINTRLGWDVTDFGSDDFHHIGRTIFTLRNGNVYSKRYTKPYAQKVMFLLESQQSPIHFHKSKTEDIINQGGGNILISLWKATGKNKKSISAFAVSVDGRKTLVRGGDTIRLSPGESVCIPVRTYHQFWAESGKGPVLSAEVSTTCNDITDNYWFDKGTRFPEIEENERRKYLLCSEYHLI